jgi:hypothetical protein
MLKLFLTSEFCAFLVIFAGTIFTFFTMAQPNFELPADSGNSGAQFEFAANSNSNSNSNSNGWVETELQKSNDMDNMDIMPDNGLQALADAAGACPPGDLSDDELLSILQGSDNGDGNVHGNVHGNVPPPPQPVRKAAAKASTKKFNVDVLVSDIKEDGSVSGTLERLDNGNVNLINHVRGVSDIEYTDDDGSKGVVSAAYMELIHPEFDGQKAACRKNMVVKPCNALGRVTCGHGLPTCYIFDGAENIKSVNESVASKLEKNRASSAGNGKKRKSEDIVVESDDSDDDSSDHQRDPKRARSTTTLALCHEALKGHVNFKNSKVVQEHGVDVNAVVVGYPAVRKSRPYVVRHNGGRYVKMSRTGVHKYLSHNHHFCRHQHQHMELVVPVKSGSDNAVKTTWLVYISMPKSDNPRNPRARELFVPDAAVCAVFRHFFGVYLNGVSHGIPVDIAPEDVRCSFASNRTRVQQGKNIQVSTAVAQSVAEERMAVFSNYKEASDKLRAACSYNPLGLGNLFISDEDAARTAESNKRLVYSLFGKEPDEFHGLFCDFDTTEKFFETIEGVIRQAVADLESSETSEVDYDISGKVATAIWSWSQPDSNLQNFRDSIIRSFSLMFCIFDFDVHPALMLSDVQHISEAYNSHYSVFEARTLADLQSRDTSDYVEKAMLYERQNELSMKILISTQKMVSDLKSQFVSGAAPSDFPDFSKFVSDEYAISPDDGPLSEISEFVASYYERRFSETFGPGCSISEIVKTLKEFQIQEVVNCFLVFLAKENAKRIQIEQSKRDEEKRAELAKVVVPVRRSSRKRKANKKF